MNEQQYILITKEIWDKFNSLGSAQYFANSLKTIIYNICIQQDFPLLCLEEMCEQVKKK